MLLLTKKLIPIFSKGRSLFSSNFHAQKNSQKLIKTIDSYSKINIASDVSVTIRPYNVFDCHESNFLIDASAEVNICGKDINVVNKSKSKDFDNTCVIDVPIQADLNIQSAGFVTISDMYSDSIKVSAEKGIATKNLRNTRIDLETLHGDIDCKGLLLGKEISIQTKGNGKVTLDKVQGDQIRCETTDGDISTKACYVQKSKFITDTGNLCLKNIHKTLEIFINKKANLVMTGVHGNISIRSCGGKVYLQLSEIKGDNIIKIDDDDLSTVYISDLIEESSFIEINAKKIKLHDSLSHLASFLVKNSIFQTPCSQNKLNKLSVSTNGYVEFGKLGWAETIKISLGSNDN